MIVKESGVAVGWPLNLGHDTTGWPLGLRLRLMHEDLQWPRKSDLGRSSSRLSSDSSSLDTLSTRSFFQDKSVSLGTLIGLPILNSVGNRQNQQQPQPRAFRSPSTTPPRTFTTSPVRTAAKHTVMPRPKSRLRHHGRSPAKQLQRHHHPSISTQASPSAASSAGWSLLSVLSCARVPAEINAFVKEEPAKAQLLRASKTSMRRPHIVGREELLSSLFQEDSELEPEESRENPLPPTKQQLRWNSLARNLYDNITFEDEERELSNGKQTRSTRGLSPDGSSREWNPLFASSSQQGLDEEENEDHDDVSHDQRVGGVPSLCDRSQQASCTNIPLMAVLRSSNTDSDALLYYHKGSRVRIGCPTVTTFCLDVGKWQQKQRQLSLEKSQQHVDNSTERESQSFKSRQAPDYIKNKAVSAFISRMRLNRRMRTSRVDGAWLNTCIGPFATYRVLWGSIFQKARR